jgi:hypothetical protein
MTLVALREDASAARAMRLPRMRRETLDDWRRQAAKEFMVAEYGPLVGRRGLSQDRGSIADALARMISASPVLVNVHWAYSDSGQ